MIGQRFFPFVFVWIWETWRLRLTDHRQGSTLHIRGVFVTQVTLMKMNAIHPFQAHSNRNTSCDRESLILPIIKLWTPCTVLLSLLESFTGTRDVFRLDPVQKRATRLVKILKGLLKGSRGKDGSLAGQQWERNLTLVNKYPPPKCLP
jgi:hypothetical protein